MTNNVNIRTPIELHRAGMEALVKELGAVDATRFIHLYDNGHGDYTKERHEMFKEMSVDDIWEDMKRKQNNKAD